MTKHLKKLSIIAALCALVATSTVTWMSSTTALASPAKAAVAAPTTGEEGGDDDAPPAKHGKSASLSGKLNLNSATSDQLQLLPGVGPSKADRIVAWRKKNGAFKRVADLRKVKGFGYKTLKKLEAYLDVKGDNTLAPN